MMDFRAIHKRFAISYACTLTLMAIVMGLVTQDYPWLWLAYVPVLLTYTRSSNEVSTMLSDLTALSKDEAE